MDTNLQKQELRREYLRVAQIKTREGIVSRLKRIEDAVEHLEDIRAMLECLVERQREPHKNGYDRESQ